MSYRKRVAQSGDSGEALDTLPCSRCAALATCETLATYGGQCFGCYERYRQEPQPTVNVGDKRDSLRSWARALKAREQGGDRLTWAQKQAWREVLKREAA
jgi:hypothetical protein